jgi:hypothetical protein
VAIGSSPEIGVVFNTWGKMTDQEKEAWFAHMDTWGRDGQHGYGTVAHPSG